MTKRSQYLAFAVVVAAAGTFAGCAQRAPSRAPASPSIVHIVAVERVYGDLAERIGGSAVTVTTILNSPTSDPHAYEPTPRDADAVAAADIVIENGLGYDAFVQKLLDASPRYGRAVIDVGSVGDHHTGENPHVWYDPSALRRLTDELTLEIIAHRHSPTNVSEFATRRADIDGWIDRLAKHLTAIGRAHPHAPVAVTEPVFDYVLHAAGARIVTPPTYALAIERGTDPSPQDVESMQQLIASHSARALVYNEQTVSTATTRLRAAATAAHVPIVSVTETLPSGLHFDAWIDREVAALARTL